MLSNNIFQFPIVNYCFLLENGIKCVALICVGGREQGIEKIVNKWKMCETKKNKSIKLKLIITSVYDDNS